MTQTVDNPNSQDAKHSFSRPLADDDTMAGADVVGALRAIGVTNRFAVLGLAFSLGVSASTIYRWRKGTRRPNRANFAKLREYVARRQASLAHAQPASRAGDRRASFEYAIGRLSTTVERAADERLAEDIANHLRSMRGLIPAPVSA